MTCRFCPDEQSRLLVKSGPMWRIGRVSVGRRNGPHMGLEVSSAGKCLPPESFGQALLLLVAEDALRTRDAADMGTRHLCVPAASRTRTPAGEPTPRFGTREPRQSGASLPRERCNLHAASSSRHRSCVASALHLKHHGHPGRLLQGQAFPYYL